jgi:ATP-dependent RNA helicase DOB1
VEVDGEAYVESFRPTLMDVVYNWSKGAAFAEVCLGGSRLLLGGPPAGAVWTAGRAPAACRQPAQRAVLDLTPAPHLASPPKPQVCGMTELYEGSIIRAIRRLDELLTQCAAAADEVGDKGLGDAFRGAQESIRRDIVFAASLYI